MAGFDDWLRDKLLGGNGGGGSLPAPPQQLAPNPSALASVLGIRAPQPQSASPAPDAMAFMARLLGGPNAPPPNAQQQALLGLLTATADQSSQLGQGYTSSAPTAQQDAALAGLLSSTGDLSSQLGQGYTPYVPDPIAQNVERLVSRQHIINDANARGTSFPVPAQTSASLMPNPAIYEEGPDDPLGSILSSTTGAIADAAKTAVTQSPLKTGKQAVGGVLEIAGYPGKVSQSVIGDIMLAAAKGEDIPAALQGLPFADSFYRAVTGDIKANPEIKDAIIAGGGGNESFDGALSTSMDKDPAWLQFIGSMAVGTITDPTMLIPVIPEVAGGLRTAAEGIETASKARQVARTLDAADTVADAARAGDIVAEGAGVGRTAAQNAQAVDALEQGIQASRRAQAAAAALRGGAKGFETIHRVSQLPEDIVFKGVPAVVRGAGEVVDILPGGTRLTGAVRRGAEFATEQTDAARALADRLSQRRAVTQLAGDEELRPFLGPSAPSDPFAGTPLGGTPPPGGGLPGAPGEPVAPTGRLSGDAPLPARWARDAQAESARVIRQLAIDEPSVYRSIYKELDARTDEFERIIADPNVSPSAKLLEESRYAKDIERLIANAGGTPIPRLVRSTAEIPVDIPALPAWASTEPIALPGPHPSGVPNALPESGPSQPFTPGEDVGLRDFTEPPPREVRTISRGKYTYIGEGSEYRVVRTQSGKARIDVQDDYGKYKPLGRDPFRATTEDAVAEAQEIVQGNRPLTTAQLSSPTAIQQELVEAPVPWAEPSPTSVADETVAPMATSPTNTTANPSAPQRRGPMTQEERNAAIRAGKISVMTPVEGGDRLLDRAFTRSLEDPSAKPVYDALVQDITPDMQAWRQRSERLGRAYFPDLDNKIVAQGLNNIEATVDTIVPAYQRFYPNDPIDLPVAERRVVAKTKSGKASFQNESLPYLMERYVFRGDTRALAAIKGRLRAQSGAQGVIDRLEGARTRLRELSGLPPDAPIVSPSVIANAPTTTGGFRPAVENLDELTAPSLTLPGLGDATRPVVGSPTNLLDVPVQTTAPTLNLQAQVLDTPEARRQAETLNGQTEMFGGQATPTGAVNAPSAEPLPSDLDPNFRRVTTDRIQTDTGAYQMREAEYARPTVDHIKATWDDSVGIREPITVTVGPDDTYTVLSGHSRLQAVRELIDEGKIPADTTIPIQVRTGTAEDLQREALTSNDRTALGPAEEGHKIRRMLDAGEAPEIARGTLRPVEANRRVALTYLPKEMQALVNADPTLVSSFAPMGKLVQEGKSNAADVAAYWYNRAMPNRLSPSQIAEELAIAQQLKANAATASPTMGLFDEIDAPSSAINQATKANEALRAEKGELDRVTRSYKGVNKDIKAQLDSPSVPAEEKQRLLDQLSGNDARVGEIGRRITALQDRLSGILTGRTSWSSADIVPPEFQWIWKITGTEPVADAAALAENTATQEARRVAEAGRAATPTPDTSNAYVPDTTGAMPESVATERAATQLPPDDILRRAHERGIVDDEAFNELNTTTTFGGKYTQDKVTKVYTLEGAEEKRLADVFASNMAEGMTPNEAVEATLSALSPDIPVARRNIIRRSMSAFWNGLGSFAREHLMANAVFGPVKIAADQLGDSFGMFTSGRMGAALKSYDIRKVLPIYRDIRKGAVDAAAASDFGRRAERLGIVDPSVTIGAGTEVARDGVARSGEMTVHRWVENITGSHRMGTLTGAIASQQVRDFRTAYDVFRRTLTGEEVMVTQLAKDRDALFDLIRDRAQHGDAEALIAGLGDEFSVRDIYRLGEQAGFEPGQLEQIARPWRAKVSGIEKAVRDETKRVHFDFAPTKADEWLKNAFMFHTWQARAAPLYLRNMLRNPALASTYHRVAEEMDRQCQGQPDATCGYLKLWSSGDGYAVYANPLAMFSSALINLEPDQWQNPDASMIDRVLGKVPAMVHPALQGILSGLGYSDKKFDPLTMGTMVNTLKAVVDFGRADGWFGEGASHSLSDDGYQNFLNTLQGAIFTHVGSKVGGKQPGMPDPNARDKELIQARIRDLIYEDNGIAFGTTLDLIPDEVRDRIYASYTAWDQGKADTYADQAFHDYVGLGGEGGQRLAGLVTPGGARLRSETQDALAVARDAAFDAGETQRGYDLADTANIARIGGTKAIQVQSGQDAYHAAGTDVGRQAASFWADIAHGSTPGTHDIGGKTWTNSEIVALDQDSRTALANAWVAENGGTAELAATRDARDAVLATNPEAKAYQDWRNAAYDYQNGNVAAFREQTAKGNQNYRRYIDQLPDDTKNDPAKFDAASVNPDAYLAYLGEKATVYDPQSLPVRDPESVPYAATEGTGTGSTPYEKKPVDPIAQLQKDAIQYQTDLIMFNQTLVYLTGNSNADYAQLNPMLRQAVDAKATDMGIYPPSKPASIDRYERWAQAQAAMGKVTDLTAYAAWLARVEPVAAAKGLEVGQVVDVALSGNTAIFSGDGGFGGQKDPYQGTALGQ